MRKDYSQLDMLSDAEPDPARFWTTVWESADVDGNLNTIKRRIETSQEFKVVAPYFHELKRSGRPMLDGGCGLGGWVVYLQSQGIDIIGVDFSAPTVERLRALFPQCRWQCGDITNLEIPDGTFSGYISWGTFEHFEIGAGPPLREAHRVLADGGLLMISVPYDNVRVALQHMGSADLSSLPNQNLGFYQWRFNRREIARELARHGFEPLAVTPIHAVEGARRFVTSVGGGNLPDLPREILARGMRWLLPPQFLCHMLLVVGRKRSGSDI